MLWACDEIDCFPIGELFFPHEGGNDGWWLVITEDDWASNEPEEQYPPVWDEFADP